MPKIKNNEKTCENIFEYVIKSIENLKIEARQKQLIAIYESIAEELIDKRLQI
jgi:hypothetical protein